MFFSHHWTPHEEHHQAPRVSYQTNVAQVVATFQSSHLKQRGDCLGHCEKSECRSAANKIAASKRCFMKDDEWRDAIMTERCVFCVELRLLVESSGQNCMVSFYWSPESAFWTWLETLALRLSNLWANDNNVRVEWGRLKTQTVVVHCISVLRFLGATL